MNSFVKRSALATALSAALLAPVGFASAATAAPDTSSVQQATERPLTVDPVSYTIGKTMTVSGTAAPGTEIGVNGLPGGGHAVRTVADGSGRWAVTSPDAVRLDLHMVLVGAYMGDHGMFLEDRLVQVQKASPEQESKLTVSTTSFVKGQKQLIEGTAKPGALVEVHLGSRHLMNTTADSSGNWSYVTGNPITDSTFTRTVKSAGERDVTFTLTAE